MERQIVKLKILADGSEYYFGSLAAIYDVFPAEAVGIRLRDLWSKKLCVGAPVVTGLCEISKHKIYQKTRENSTFAESSSTRCSRSIKKEAGG